MKTSEDRIRTFIAIEIPTDIRQKIGEFQRRLMGRIGGVSWVKIGNIHLTIKFLGDVQISSLQSVKKILEEETRGVSPFKMKVQGFGAFPSIERPRILWIGTTQIEGNSFHLFKRRCDERLLKLGFEKEDRPYRPHLTIGRCRGSRPSIDPVLLDHLEDDFGTFTVKEVILFKSLLTPQGAIYTELFKSPFSL